MPGAASVDACCDYIVQQRLCCVTMLDCQVAKIVAASVIFEALYTIGIFVAHLLGLNFLCYFSGRDCKWRVIYDRASRRLEPTEFLRGSPTGTRRYISTIHTVYRVST
jgi:hypothetical protein